MATQRSGSGCSVLIISARRFWPAKEQNYALNCIWVVVKIMVPCWVP